MEVYRFRSIDRLLGEYQELENKTIYFASPDQLNDPMEGYRDIVWRGDKIVWTNFFKHYVFCLHAISLRLGITRGPAELNADDIPIQGRWDRLLTPQEQEFDSIWNRFCNISKVPETIEAIADTNRDIRYGELGYYLWVIQNIFTSLILETDIAHVPISESERQQYIERMPAIVQEDLEFILTLITVPETTGMEERSNVVFRKVEALISNQILISLSLGSISAGELEPVEQLLFDFPKMYLKAIERLLWPKWYTACFTKGYHNSSVWGNYADKHKGACLIFESAIADESNGLELRQRTDKRVGTIPAYEVSYAKMPDKVDFFRSIAWLPSLAVLKKLWYMDEKGNISECADHIQSDGARDDWYDRCWDSFYRDIIIKTEDWEYEQEWRLILADKSGKFDEEENRTLFYNFNSLKGIIFGIKTAHEDKLRIVKLIQKKCRKSNRTDFKFYQACYSPEDGKILKEEIPL